MPNEVFANQIKRIRKNEKMTMEEFARSLGVTKSSVNMWENKGVVPREELLRNIAEKFNVSLDKLLGVQSKGNEDDKLHYLQRNLGRLDNENLKKAESLLKTVFNEIFDDEDGDEDDDI